MKNKIWFLLLLFIVIGACFQTVYANNNVLQIVEQSSETQYLANDQGFISKEIVSSDLQNGEVTIELKLSNTRKESGTIKKYDNTEIYLMISENISREEEKLERYINNIDKLCTKIFNYDSKTKIGIIGITGTIYDGEEVDGVMVWGENDEGNVNGSANNAEIIVEPTNDINIIKQGIQNMNSSKIHYHINLQAGIRLAYNSFTEETNKILVSLYDGVPNIAIGVKSLVTYGGLFSEFDTAEEAIIDKHDNISTYTRNEILTLKNKNISFILLRPGDTSYDETWYSYETGEKGLDFDGSPYVQKLYGTIENPTYGKMYLFDDTNIDTIITENMEKDVEEIIEKWNLSNIVVEDYFPQEIIEYFEFTYVGNPDIGTVSDKIDENSKTISWNIETLKNDEVGTLKYKLKLKDMNNEELLEKTIATNEKVVLTYLDKKSDEYTVTLTSSPKIKLHKVEENIEGLENEQDDKQDAKTQTEDTTLAKIKLPNTGKKLIFGFSIITIITLTIYIIKRNKDLKGI